MYFPKIGKVPFKNCIGKIYEKIIYSNLPYADVYMHINY